MRSDPKRDAWWDAGGGVIADELQALYAGAFLPGKDVVVPDSGHETDACPLEVHPEARSTRLYFEGSVGRARDWTDPHNVRAAVIDRFRGMPGCAARRPCGRRWHCH